MSKAFTRESDADPNDDALTRRRSVPDPLITPDGARRLQEELDRLLQHKQAGALTEADLKLVQARIRYLQEFLHSIVIAPKPADPRLVGVGARVKVRHGNGEEICYEIVGVEESDPERGKISWKSPLARHLLGRQAGEKFKFQAPAGTEELEILSVMY